MSYEYPSGATPIAPDEEEGLLLPHITNRTELDRWEQDNDLAQSGDCRQRYITALQAADSHEYKPCWNSCAHEFSYNCLLPLFIKGPFFMPPRTDMDYGCILI